MSKPSRPANVLQWLVLVPLVALSGVSIYAFLPFVRAAAKSPSVQAQTTEDANSQKPGLTEEEKIAARFKEQDDRISKELDSLKERAQTQQSLITALTGLTGVYVLILSVAAYSRLQQTKEESLESVAATKAKMSDFIQEVRADIPALHGIGRRLETLLAELSTRLPVDSEWNDPTTFPKLSAEDRQQLVIDEMVINSLDIFNVTKDLSNRRTISGLYTRLGQFYFGKASFLHTLKPGSSIDRALGAKVSGTPEEDVACLCRASIYFEKAIKADATDAVALRARGVLAQHTAVWEKNREHTPTYNPLLLAESKRFITRSLAADEHEPGALFANAWLVANSVPPDYRTAGKNLSVIITNAEKLNGAQRRKFLAFAHLNRANYAARTIKGSDIRKEDKVLEVIVSDIETGKRVAAESNRAEVFLAELKREIAPQGDLNEVYLKSSAVRSAADKLLT